MYPQSTSTQSHHCQTGSTKVHPSVKISQTGLKVSLFFSSILELCLKAMLENIGDTPQFSLRGVPTFGTTTFVIFEETLKLHSYTSYTQTFLLCCPMKRYEIFAVMLSVYFCEILYVSVLYF